MNKFYELKDLFLKAKKEKTLVRLSIADIDLKGYITKIKENQLIIKTKDVEILLLF